MDGDRGRAVRADQGQFAGAAWQRQPVEPSVAERAAVGGRAGLPVAGAAEAVWQLAHPLHAQEPLVEKRRAGPGLRETATGADGAPQSRGGRAGLDLGQGAPGRHGCVKKNGPQAIGQSRGGWNTKVHLVAADARTALTFALSPGQAHDAPEGRALLRALGPPDRPLHLLMDKAYEGDETRQLALDLGFVPVVPPKSNRLEPWEYDREMY